MADYLIQRYSQADVPLPAPGVWVDEGTVANLSATDDAEVKAAIEDFVINRGQYLDAQRRVSRWDTVVEFTLQPSKVSAVKQPKAVRT